MKRYKVDFSYGRYYFKESPDGDWMQHRDAEFLVKQALDVGAELIQQVMALKAECEKLKAQPCPRCGPDGPLGNL